MISDTGELVTKFPPNPEESEFVVTSELLIT